MKITAHDTNIQLDIRHFGEFDPEEISVKVVGNHVEITGNQKWRQHPAGAVKRSFVQRHNLPLDADKDHVSAYLTASGQLVIKCPSVSQSALEAKMASAGGKRVHISDGSLKMVN
ncbi:Alpha-crystallin A chain [Halotydeus destructor]|nr:Alpha-crystallin A chain [Halotydeus destructor]